MTPIKTEEVAPTLVIDAAIHAWDAVLFALYLQELQKEHGLRLN